MIQGPSVQYLQLTVDLCSLWPICSVLEPAYGGGKPIVISEQAAHNYRTPVFADCAEFPSGPGPSGRIVAPSAGRFILALRHTRGAVLAPRQRHAVAADQTVHGVEPGNQIQQRFSRVCCELGGLE